MPLEIYEAVTRMELVFHAWDFQITFEKKHGDFQ